MLLSGQHRLCGPLDTPINKFIVTTQNVHRNALLTALKVVPNGEAVFAPVESYEHSVAECLLRFTTRAPLPGTVLLIAERGAYCTAIRLMQRAGWYVILARPPGVADSLLLNTVNETVLLPLQHDIRSGLMSILGSAHLYAASQKNTVDMSPLNMQSTCQLVEDFKKNKCCLDPSFLATGDSELLVDIENSIGSVEELFTKLQISSRSTESRPVIAEAPASPQDLLRRAQEIVKQSARERGRKAATGRSICKPVNLSQRKDVPLAKKLVRQLAKQYRLD